MLPAAADSPASIDPAPPGSYINHPSGFHALSPRNERWQMSGLPGFIAYREQGRHLVLSGGIHAPASSWAPLFKGLTDQAARRGKRILAIQVRSEQVSFFAGLGFTVNQMGSSFSLGLDKLDFSGTARMKLRNKIKRAGRSGLRVLEVGRELPRGQEAFDRIQGVSRAWLARKRKKELDFMIGELGTPSDVQRRIFVVENERRELVGYVTYVPVWGERPGLLHDLTRKMPDAPPGAMELCNATAMERFHEEGVPHLHFGFTPFIVDEQPNPGRSSRIAWFFRQLLRHGAFIYPAETQAAYKQKWGSLLVEREFIAGKPLGLRAIWDLLILTRSI